MEIWVFYLIVNLFGPTGTLWIPVGPYPSLEECADQRRTLVFYWMRGLKFPRISDCERHAIDQVGMRERQ